MTEHKSHVSEAAMGTINYMPPEMLEHQRLTKAVRDGQCCDRAAGVGHAAAAPLAAPPPLQWVIVSLRAMQVMRFG